MATEEDAIEMKKTIEKVDPKKTTEEEDPNTAIQMTKKKVVWCSGSRSIAVQRFVGKYPRKRCHQERTKSHGRKSGHAHYVHYEG
jgi:hypothetical protein